MTSTLLVVGIQGLGREVALHFAAQGWRVGCASRTAATTEALAKEVSAAGGEGIALACDLTDRSSLAALGALAPDLVVAAQSPGGRFGSKPLVEIDDDELERGHATMVRGTWNLLKAVGPAMLARGSGTFVQVGTSSGVRTRDGFAVLGAVSSAQRSIVQVAAKEWRPKGVHVAYVPIDGPIESERSKGYGLPQSRLLDPKEITRGIAYLHSQSPRAWTHELLLRPNDGEWTTPT